MAKSFVKAITLTGVDSATFGAAFQRINPNGLPHACFLIRIINGSNRTVTISYNGVDTHDVLLPNDTLELDLQANSSPNGFIAYLKKGTVVYANATIAGVGIVSLVGYYQEI